MNDSMDMTNMEVEEQVPGIALDSNGKPIGGCSIVELFDELDAEFVLFYGMNRMLCYQNTLINRQTIDLL
jgi:hypothetical protein